MNLQLVLTYAATDQKAYGANERKYLLVVMAEEIKILILTVVTAASLLAKIMGL